MINQPTYWLIQIPRKKFMSHFLFFILTESAILAEIAAKSTGFKCLTANKSFKNEILVDLNEKHIWTWKNRTPKGGLIVYPMFRP